jgi:hypothetical protein
MIYFGNYQFSEPVVINEWETDEKAGIYVILVQDSGAKSQSYKAIYFGESENLSDSSFLGSHRSYDRWIRESESEGNLYIATFAMPDSALELRQGIVAFLVKYYHPVCNE